MIRDLWREIVVAAVLVAIAASILLLAGCSQTDDRLAKFTSADVTAAAVAAADANDTLALGCFRPMAKALSGGATPGVATLIEAQRLCKGLLPGP